MRAEGYIVKIQRYSIDLKEELFMESFFQFLWSYYRVVATCPKELMECIENGQLS